MQIRYGRRIHKGTPLQYLGMIYYNLNQLEQSRKYHALAFVEDVLRDAENCRAQGRGFTPDLVPSPAMRTLQMRFRMGMLEMWSLQDFVRRNGSPESCYPEELLSDWIKETDKNKKVVVARSREETLYRVNLNYLRRLRDSARDDSRGNKLESLAFYLFSCVDGFEPVLQKKTSAFHFDVLVRNLVKDHPLLQSFGEYMGIECKNLRTHVTVEELNHFIHKLNLHSMRCGIIFTTDGISGIRYKKDPHYGKAIQDKTFNRDGIVVFDMTDFDLDRVVEGANLLSILLSKYEGIRFQ